MKKVAGKVSRGIVGAGNGPSSRFLGGFPDEVPAETLGQADERQPFVSPFAGDGERLGDDPKAGSHSKEWNHEKVQRLTKPRHLTKTCRLPNLIAHKTQRLAEMSETVYSKQVTVTSPNGLHLRPLEMLVSLARQYDSKIEIIKDTERIDGKSMMEGLGLISGQGTQLTIEACGEDAQEALAALARLFEASFEESPVDSPEPPAS